MKNEVVPEVDPNEAKRLIDHEGAILIDCRERKEWDKSRIPGAQLKPMSTVNDWYGDLPTDGTVLIHCESGARSAQITHALTSQVGLSNVLNVAGGIKAWRKAGLPTTR